MSTVGNLGSLEIRSVASDQRNELVRWIHHTAMPAELKAIEADYQLRSSRSWSPTPLEALAEGRRLAASYFSCLPGDLATLGGVRAINDQATGLAAQLLVSQIGLIRQRFPDAYVQAAIDVNDLKSQHIVRQAGFTQLTEVDQLWLGLSDQPLLNPQDVAKTTKTVHFQPANTLSRLRFERLLGETFDQTLDCPELNGIRTLKQVLNTFLAGKPFRDCHQWNIVFLDNRLAGCLLLTQHNRELIELSYMGLSRWARGKGLGAHLIHAAQQQSKELGANMLVVAADVRNWPAIQHYKKYGFQFHRRLRLFEASPKTPML